MGIQVEVFDLDLAEFSTTLQLQYKLVRDIREGRLTSALILCRHSPVITLGRLADKKNILCEEKVKNNAISVLRAERGGDVTYHGPGQLIAYPIFDLSKIKKDVHLFLRNLESVVISLLSEMNINAIRNPGFTGVWIDDREAGTRRKVSSIGIAIKNWITFHGLSINVKKEDLLGFNLIRPCGMNIEMTSLETILHKKLEFEPLKKMIVDKFKEIFKACC